MKQTSHPFSTDHFLHGGDYNPDQWLDRPDILENRRKATTSLTG